MGDISNVEQLRPAETNTVYPSKVQYPGQQQPGARAAGLLFRPLRRFRLRKTGLGDISSAPQLPPDVDEIHGDRRRGRISLGIVDRIFG